MTATPFTTGSDTIARRITTGLSKIGLALRHQAWEAGYAEGLTPTQGQILALLNGSGAPGLQLSEVAEQLSVSAATASAAVTTLVNKGLVKKTRSRADGRAILLRLTARGVTKAGRTAEWPDFLMEAVDGLEPHEQQVLLRGLIKMIRRLQEQGRIPVARMCVTCRYFQPHAHADAERPHHCLFVDAAFGDGHLRLDCPDHDGLDPEPSRMVWERFLTAQTSGSR